MTIRSMVMMVMDGYMGGKSMDGTRTWMGPRVGEPADRDGTALRLGD
jgi:hypothetical protein